jgi:hypothetical protein
MALMGFREYARHRQVTLRAVQKAIEAGRISLVEIDGARKIDSDQADRDWRVNTDPAAQSLLYSAGPAVAGVMNNQPQADAGLATGPGAAMSAAPGSANAASEPEDEPASSDQTTEYRIERAKRERIRREREEIELEEIRGNYIPLSEAELTVFTAFRTLRDSMLQVPTRIKDRCAAATDPFMVEQIIEAEVAATFARFDPAKMVLSSADDEEEAHDAV